MVYGGNANNKNVADKNVGGRGTPRPKRPKDGGENKKSLIVALIVATTMMLFRAGVTKAP